MRQEAYDADELLLIGAVDDGVDENASENANPDEAVALILVSEKGGGICIDYLCMLEHTMVSRNYQRAMPKCIQEALPGNFSSVTFV